MKVSLKWLREYVDFPTDTQAFCDKLDLTGTGVEGVDAVGATYDNVVTAQIVEKAPHPDSDHMWVTKVNVGKYNVDADGNPEPLQIVCGAQNFEAGDHIVTALVGAEFGDFKIKKSKLRGVVSNGMNCSERELGLGNNHDGIMILPPDAPIGMPFAEYAKLSDTVLDLEITPNRPDCLSMEGMAREVGAMYRNDVTFPIPELTEAGDAVENYVDVTIADEERCPRYTARVIKDVKVGPSPDWLVERISAAGARSINNVVDITNYILFLLGQPLHAFDFDNLDLEDGKAHIIVRPAEDGEEFTTLDGEDRKLTSDMTVIATPKRAVALAGVMGGLDSEVTETTVNVLLEAATFSSAHTSRTSRNLGLISESSMRYERKVDAATIQRNTDFAAALIAEICGGTVCKGTVDQWPVKTEVTPLQFRYPRFCGMMGAVVPREDVVDILVRLGCQVTEAEGDGTTGFVDRNGVMAQAVADGGAQVYTVVPPTFRPDLEREIDLYEEVLRLYGMEKFEPTLPGGRGRIGLRSEAEKVVSTLHGTLQACGLNETMTYSFAHPEDVDTLRMNKEGIGEAVQLINPLNADQSVMRQSIIPGLLRGVSYNQAHGVQNIQLYEIGNVFYGHEGKQLPRERQKVAGVLCGAMTQKGWNVEPAGFDFFDGKGVLESIARELAFAKVHFKATDPEVYTHLQPGRGAEMYSGGTLIGWVGEIHPLAVADYDIDGTVVAFELDVEAMVNSARPARDYVDVATYPAVKIDVAFVVDEKVTHETLMQRMKSAGGKLLEGAELFDVYRDEQRLGAGKKSMAYNLTYRAADRTLTGEEVEKAHAKLVKKVCGSTGAEVRG